MFTLFFGDFYAAATTVTVAALLIFIVCSLYRFNTVKRWGRRIAILTLAGTGVSFLSAMRDRYAEQGALFAMDSMQSNLCSLAGGAIFLTAVISIFLKDQKKKRFCFTLISILFAFMVALIEASRIIS